MTKGGIMLHVKYVKDLVKKGKPLYPGKRW